MVFGGGSIGVCPEDGDVGCWSMYHAAAATF